VRRIEGGMFDFGRSGKIEEQLQETGTSQGGKVWVERGRIRR